MKQALRDIRDWLNEVDYPDSYRLDPSRWQACAAAYYCEHLGIDYWLDVATWVSDTFGEDWECTPISNLFLSNGNDSFGEFRRRINEVLEYYDA